MAPKRKANVKEAEAAAVAAGSSKPKRAKKNLKAPPLDETFTRVTRSLAKQDSRLARSVTKAEPQKKPKPKGKAKAAASPSGSNKKSKKEKAIPKENDKEGENDAEEEEEEDETKELGKTLIIEYCKQCSSFKRRAMQVQEGLQEAVPEITVLLNPDNPRKGCFEIREDGGEKFVSLLDMKRPFRPMKDLDMEKVISDLIEKIKS